MTTQELAAAKYIFAKPGSQALRVLLLHNAARDFPTDTLTFLPDRSSGRVMEYAKAPRAVKSLRADAFNSIFGASVKQDAFSGIHEQITTSTAPVINSNKRYLADELFNFGWSNNVVRFLFAPTRILAAVNFRMRTDRYNHISPLVCAADLEGMMLRGVPFVLVPTDELEDRSRFPQEFAHNLYVIKAASVLPFYLRGVPMFEHNSKRAAINAGVHIQNVAMDAALFKVKWV